MTNSKRLVFEDYNIPCQDLAKNLLGKLLVRKLENNVILRGKIVETESYLGGEDKASHSYNNRRTPKNEPMFMKAGTCYVYITYGMYHCMNISSKEPGSAVLLRALEPICGESKMQEHRLEKKNANVKKLEDLCNGPAKLCISMDITKENCNKLDLTECEELWIEDPEGQEDINIVASSRIGIASAGDEWANKPLRFYILGNKHVSKKDRKAEKLFLE